jgi:mono/diheme cytochrome c family protein
VSARSSVANAVRTPVALVPALFGLVLLSGCGGETYPEDLEYPVRTGLMVVTEPTVKPPDSYEPLGHLDQWLNSVYAQELDEKKNEVVNLDTGLTPGDRAQYQQELKKLFGTPASPKVEGIDAKTKEDLKLDDKTLALGSQLYRRHCLHCHGLTGDGHGPTAPWVNPHPRDYRRGIFKFSSSQQPTGVRKPRREDLLRTLREGVEGTSMPSFRLLPEEELNALVSYVIHLSLRGQAEFDTMKTQLPPGPGFDASEGETIPSVLADRTKTFAQQWWDASFAEEKGKLKYPIEPGHYPDSLSKQAFDKSVQSGYDLFVKPGAASCIGCHTDFGRKSSYKFDAWGTIVKPTDLTTGVFRGGRRPVDLYYRIHSGINGSAMTSFADSVRPTDDQLENLSDENMKKLKGDAAKREEWERTQALDREVKRLKLTDKQKEGLSRSFASMSEDDKKTIRDELAWQRLWDLVNFVQALPYPQMLPEELRATIYGLPLDSNKVALEGR